MTWLTLRTALSAAWSHAGSFGGWLWAHRVHIALVALFLGFWWWGDHKAAIATAAAEQACTARQALTDNNGVKANAKIERGVHALSDPDLDRELLKWLR